LIEKQKRIFILTSFKIFSSFKEKDEKILILIYNKMDEAKSNVKIIERNLFL
jgi:hypothetical protein